MTKFADRIYICTSLLIQSATPEKPLVIILDSLDQLSANNHAHRLNWMPWQLPANVRLIVSTLTTNQRILGKLQDMTQSQANFLEVKPLGTYPSYAIVKGWLQKENRRITKMQVMLYFCSRGCRRSAVCQVEVELSHTSGTSFKSSPLFFKPYERITNLASSLRLSVCTKKHASCFHTHETNRC